MRKDTNKDLDLLFKEGLEDAAVKAPRGVWEAVSARLDAAAPAAAAAPKRSWLLWGAPAFAFAAAALAVVLFVGKTDNNIIQSGEELISVADAQPSGPVAMVEENAEPASKPTRVGYVPKEIQTPEQITVIPQIADQVGDDKLSGSVKDPEDRQAGGLGGTPHSPSGVQGDDSQPAQQAACPSGQLRSSGGEKQTSEAFWAQMDAEAEKPAGRLALKAGGIVGGNDAHIQISRPAFSSGLPSEGIQETSISNYTIPMSVGLSARYHFTEKLAVSAGINWSYLSRDFKGNYKTESGVFTHNLQYIGVPVSVSYDVIDSKTLLFYCYAGGNAEKAISSKYYIRANSSAPILTEQVPGLQYGLFGGIGVEFKLTDRLGLYADPCVKYYFPGNQPKSIRTDRPLMFSLEAGLRFNL